MLKTMNAPQLRNPSFLPRAKVEGLNVRRPFGDRSGGTATAARGSCCNGVMISKVTAYETSKV